MATVRRLRAALGEAADAANELRATLTRAELEAMWRALRTLEEASSVLEERAAERKVAAP